MAGAPLTQRVERLLAAPPHEVVHRERWWRALGLAALALVSGAAPGFAAALRYAPAAAAPAPASAVVTAPAPVEPEPEASPEPSIGSAPNLADESPLSAAIGALDDELELAMAELRDLKREIVGAGAVERFAARLTLLEESIRTLSRQREAVQDLLPRALASLRDAQ
jgi:hypothetical protein